MTKRTINADDRLELRYEIDAALSLLDLALYALRIEHDYQRTQVRAVGLPCISSIIKTLSICTGKLEICWTELKLEGDVDHEPTLWRPDRPLKKDAA